jgi:hypothetical protein
MLDIEQNSLKAVTLQDFLTQNAEDLGAWFANFLPIESPPSSSDSSSSSATSATFGPCSSCDFEMQRQQADDELRLATVAKSIISIQIFCRYCH